MKLVFVVFSFCFVSIFSFTQDWKKELFSARKSYKEGNYKEALNKYKSAQKLAPKGIDLADEIAQATYKAEDFEKAEKVYNGSSSKKGSAIQQAKTYHNIGNAKLKQRKYQEAVDAYKESLRRNPNDNETRYNLSEALKQQKKEQQKQDNKKDNSPNKNSPNPKDQDNKKENKDETKKDNQEKNSSKNQDGGEKKTKLSDKKTERMLNDLQKKEMETKKKLDSNKGKSSKKSTGKDW